MTAFDKAWDVVKTRGFDIRDHAKRSHNEYIPVDGNGVPIALEPMDYFEATAVAEGWEGDEHSGWDHESHFKPASIVMFEGSIADEINDYGHLGIDAYRKNEYYFPPMDPQEEAFDRYLEDMERQAYRDGEMTDEERQNFLSSSIGAKWREEPKTKEVKTG